MLPGRDVIGELHTDLVQFLGVVQCLVAGRGELPTNHSVEPEGSVVLKAVWVNIPGRCDSCQQEVGLHCENVFHALHFCCPASRHHAKVELLLLRQEPGGTSKQNYFQIFLVQVWWLLKIQSQLLSSWVLLFSNSMVFKTSFRRNTFASNFVVEGSTVRIECLFHGGIRRCLVQNGSTVCTCVCEESYVVSYRVVESHQFTLLTVEDVSTKHVSHCETQSQTKEKSRNVMKVDDASADEPGVWMIGPNILWLYKPRQTCIIYNLYTSVAFLTPDHWSCILYHIQVNFDSYRAPGSHIWFDLGISLTSKRAPEQT